jgi:hypothetical protein
LLLFLFFLSYFNYFLLFSHLIYYSFALLFRLFMRNLVYFLLKWDSKLQMLKEEVDWSCDRRSRTKRRSSFIYFELLLFRLFLFDLLTTLLPPWPYILYLFPLSPLVFMY